MGLGVGPVHRQKPGQKQEIRRESSSSSFETLVVPAAASINAEEEEELEVKYLKLLNEMLCGIGEILIPFDEIIVCDIDHRHLTRHS